MELQSFARKYAHVTTMSVAVSLDNLVKALDIQLSSPHLMHDIIFGDFTFTFKSPFNEQENTQQQEHRAEFIRLILEDALATYVENMIDKDTNRDPWATISHLLALNKTKGDVASPIAPEEYEAFKEDAEQKARPINFESYDGIMEDSRITEEQRDEKLIVRLGE